MAGHWVTGFLFAFLLAFLGTLRNSIDGKNQEESLSFPGFEHEYLCDIN